MRLAAAVLFGLAALPRPVFADERTWRFLGGHGCTLSERSLAALGNAGFLEPYTRAIIENALSQGLATQEGEYVVIDASICTIRLPDIQSDLTVTSPDIQAIAPYVRDVFEYDGETTVDEGCFINDPQALFTKLNGDDPDAGTTAYLEFIGASIISGDVRFYSPSPLATPLGFQITSGGCARAPNVAAINTSHPFIASGFGDYVRTMGENTVCGGESDLIPSQFTADMQGAVMDDDFAFEAGLNAWLWYEYDLIAIAAGWHEGMTATTRGEPRPPLCHY